MENFNGPERQLVTRARVARLATVDGSGAHVVPICPVLVDGRVVIGLEKGSRKERNVAADQRVSVLFDDYVEDWNALRGVLVRGRAVVLSGEARARALQAMYEKFPQYPELAALGDTDPLIAVDADAVATWGLDG